MAQAAAGANVAAVAGDNLAADSQAHPRALKFRAAVKALKGTKNAIKIALVEADAVVAGDDLLPGAVAMRFNFNLRASVWRVKLQGIRQQVLQQLAHLHAIGVHPRHQAGIAERVPEICAAGIANERMQQ